MIVPQSLLSNARGTPEGAAWLERLPEMVEELTRRWSLRLDPPFDGDDVTASWVAPCRRADGSPAVLKVGLPHMEAEHEIDGLLFWDGDPTVRLLEADRGLSSMLLERCEPGHTLRSLPEEEQDVVVARLLRRLWRRPSSPHPFRPLSAMVGHWVDESLANRDRWPDPSVVREGLQAFEALVREGADEDGVLLATDLHAGNVLAARREPWLVIDPKPFVGDPAYDVTQHLFNCDDRMRRDPLGTLARMADLLELDSERVRLWTFARAAVETHDPWDQRSMSLARALAP
jgi:streptomycin 6-kinase